MAAGDQASEIAPSEIPANAQILSYAPALQVLQNSAVIISQAGANLIKEAIWYGVPMVLLPDRADQPGNAARVEYHNLGVVFRRTPSWRELGEQIEFLLQDGAAKTKLTKMQMAFHALDRDDLRVLEALETLELRAAAVENPSHLTLKSYGSAVASFTPETRQTCRDVA
jgi:UDP:flavonoid glycosyltransferase YjiC (YdhE family)